MAPHSSTLAWKIPWMEKPGRLQSMGSLGVGHDWATSLSFSLSCTGEGNGNPLQCSCLENPRDEGACWAAVYVVAQSWTRLKQLSSSSSSTTSLVAQMRKYLSTMQETWVQSLSQEDHLKKGMTTHPIILAWKIHGQRSLAGYCPWDCKESDTTEWLTLSLSLSLDPQTLFVL